MIFPLAGNDKIKLSVSNFISENRIPHAVLIEGEYGTGKHTLARFISSAVVCRGDNSPCGECNECRLAGLLSHPDITVVAPEDGKKNIAVAQIRQLRNDAFIKPHQAKKRVFIIDCADTMNDQSQNALLKILEEPPQTVMFILITENKASLLETVLSRCVVLTLSVPELSVGFKAIKEKTDCDDNSVKSVLEESKGNIGRALNILGGQSSSKTEVIAKEFFGFMLKGDAYQMLKTVTPFGKSRADAAEFLKDLKYLTAGKLRQTPNGSYAKALMSFYGFMPEYEQSLVTNINLNLLFCSIVCKAVELFGGTNDRGYIR